MKPGSGPRYRRGSSPTVDSAVDRWGDTLSPRVQRAIADAHGTTPHELAEDGGLEFHPSGHCDTHDFFGALGY